MPDEIDKKMEITNKILEAQREELKKMLVEHPGSVPDETIKVIIPIIRRIVPSLIASDIIGVQPMSNSFAKFRIGKTEEIDGQTWYNITCVDEIWQWIIDTIDNDQYTDGTDEYQNRFTLSPQAMMLFKLKWS